jgi:integrase
VNRLLVILKAILRYGVRNKALRELPAFPAKFDERPFIHTGHIDYWDFFTLCEQIDEEDERWLLPLITAAFVFGFRRSELLYMRVNQIDLERHTITLPAGSTKNKMPRRIVLNPKGKLAKLLAKAVKGKEQHAYVFSRDAQGSIPVRDFRVAWNKIVTAAKMKTGSGPNGGLQFHDLRRSAITRMANAGLSENGSVMSTGFVRFLAAMSRISSSSFTEVASASVPPNLTRTLRPYLERSHTPTAVRIGANLPINTINSPDSPPPPPIASKANKRL